MATDGAEAWGEHYRERAAEMETLASLLDVIEAAGGEVIEVDEKQLGREMFLSVDITISRDADPSQVLTAVQQRDLAADGHDDGPDVEDSDASEASPAEAVDVDDEADDQDADPTEDEEDPGYGLVWCGICGEGAMSPHVLARHHGHQHDGDPIPLDHEPDPSELVATDHEETAGADTSDEEATDRDADSREDSEDSADPTDSDTVVVDVGEHHEVTMPTWVVRHAGFEEGQSSYTRDQSDGVVRIYRDADAGKRTRRISATAPSVSVRAVVRPEGQAAVRVAPDDVEYDLEIRPASDDDKPEVEHGD